MELTRKGEKKEEDKPRCVGAKGLGHGTPIAA